MYETLMNLPLFRGANQDQMSSFIEKTHLEFKIFNTGDTIAKTGERCRTLKSLISGRAALRHSLFKGRLILTDEREAPDFIAPERLFGLENAYRFEAWAVTRCGTVEISKSQYLDLLRKNPVFLLNYLNHLCREAQTGLDVLKYPYVGTTKAFLILILQLLTSKQSQNIVIESPASPIKDFFRSTGCADCDIERMEDEKFVFLEAPHKLHILNRSQIVDLPD